MALEEVTKAALELTVPERFALASVLLESAEPVDPDAEAAW